MQLQLSLAMKFGNVWLRRELAKAVFLAQQESLESSCFLFLVLWLSFRFHVSEDKGILRYVTNIKQNIEYYGIRNC
jgi:hypothetical protein